MDNILDIVCIVIYIYNSLEVYIYICIIDIFVF